MVQTIAHPWRTLSVSDDSNLLSFDRLLIPACTVIVFVEVQNTGFSKHMDWQYSVVQGVNEGATKAETHVPEEQGGHSVQLDEKLLVTHMQ